MLYLVIDKEMLVNKEKSMPSTVIATTNQRIFWICKVCGHRETVDYTADTREQTLQGQRLQSVDVYRIVEGKQSTPWDERSRPCPQCGAKWGCWNERKLKKITVNDARPCNASCEMATNE